MVRDLFHRVMGIAASTNVKEIKIDQTDDKWDKLQTQKDRKRGFSISTRWVNSADAENSSNRRSRQLSSSLEAAEKRAIEAEQRVRQLEREVGTLELRNMELAQEVTWLKKQLSDRPEVPILPRPSTSANRNKLENNEEMRLQTVAKLEEQIKRYEDEILKLKTKLSKDTQRLQAELEDQKHGFDREMRSVDNHLMRANRLNEIYEDTIRQNLSTEVLSDLKSKVNTELRTSNPSSNNFNVAGSDSSLNSGNKNRAQLILELSEQISNQKEKIRYLENDIVKRDFEIGHLKELMTTSEAVLQASLNASSSSVALRKISNTSSIDQPQNQNNTNKRSVVFSASRRHSASVTDVSKPLKVEYSNTGVKNETESKSPLIAADQQRDGHRGGRLSFDLITSESREDGAAAPQWSGDDNDGVASKGHKRTVSAPKKSAGNNYEVPSALKNVYALSDDLETVRVRESPSASRMSVRPKTAAAPTDRSNSGALYGLTISELDELTVEPQLVSPSNAKPVTPGSSRNRTHSAPMLFKPRQQTASRRTSFRPEPEGRVNEIHRQPPATVDATDVMSLNDVDINKTDVLKISDNNEEAENEDDNEIVGIEMTEKSGSPKRDAQTSINASKPPRQAKRQSPGNPGSATSVYSSSAMGSEDNETSDEEIRRLLDKRTGRQNNRVAGVGGSAKSRDSGFLNESYTSAQSTNLWRNENATP